MSPEQLAAIQAMREALLVALEDAIAIGTHLREAIDIATTNVGGSLMCLSDAGDAADAAVERLRHISLKCSEVIA